jgi:hypothetical protein
MVRSVLLCPCRVLRAAGCVGGAKIQGSRDCCCARVAGRALVTRVHPQKSACARSRPRPVCGTAASLHADVLLTPLLVSCVGMYASQRCSRGCVRPWLVRCSCATFVSKLSRSTSAPFVSRDTAPSAALKHTKKRSHALQRLQRRRRRARDWQGAAWSCRQYLSPALVKALPRVLKRSLPRKKTKMSLVCECQMQL